MTSISIPRFILRTIRVNLSASTIFTPFRLAFPTNNPSINQSINQSTNQPTNQSKESSEKGLIHLQLGEERFTLQVQLGAARLVASLSATLSAALATALSIASLSLLLSASLAALLEAASFARHEVAGRSLHRLEVQDHLGGLLLGLHLALLLLDSLRLVPHRLRSSPTTNRSSSIFSIFSVLGSSTVRGAFLGGRLPSFALRIASYSSRVNTSGLGSVSFSSTSSTGLVSRGSVSALLQISGFNECCVQLLVHILGVAPVSVARTVLGDLATTNQPPQPSLTHDPFHCGAQTHAYQGGDSPHYLITKYTYSVPLLVATGLLLDFGFFHHRSDFLLFIIEGSKTILTRLLKNEQKQNINA